MDKLKLTRNALMAALVCALLPCAVYATHIPPAAAQTALNRATSLDKEKKFTEAAKALVLAIDIDPDFIAAHENLNNLDDETMFASMSDKKLEPQFKAINALIEGKYKEWEKRYPDSLGVTYGIGLRLEERENPKARSYLLKVLQRDPGNAKVYFLLAGDASRRGDEKAVLGYMQKASALEPQNPDYASAYVAELEHVDRVKWEAASRDIAKRFPTSERGAQALYWLGMETDGVAKRIAIWEELRGKFPPAKFEWSANAMNPLFEAYLGTDPVKAATFARQMRAEFAKGARDQMGDGTKEWDKRIALADTVVTVNQDLSQGKASQAMVLVDKLVTERYSSNTAMIDRLKAQVMAADGKKNEAYESLLKQQAKAPDGDTQVALQQYGKQLGKSSAQVEADLNAQLDAGAKPAPPFTLHTYASNETVSLSKLKGKVVFVTFWFPGCGPCRAEFPHLEEAMAPYRNNKDFVYLGVNINPDQDPYVDSFMEQTKYSFTPLKSDDAVLQAYDKIGAAPYNFLIDRNGRIVYSGFMATDAGKAQMVKRMIESLMIRKASAASPGVKS